MFTYTIEPTRKSPAGFEQVIIQMTEGQRFGPFYTADEAHAYAAEMGWTPAPTTTATPVTPTTPEVR